MTVCKTCGVEKGDAMFPLFGYGIGRRQPCKACWSAREVLRQRARRAADPEAWLVKMRDKGRKAYARNPEKYKGAVRAWKDRTPGSQLAHNLLNSAVRQGMLTRPEECSACGASGRTIHAHHADYAKPLEVAWLCPTCHKELHLRQTHFPT